jgi:hypothetical protein
MLTDGNSKLRRSEIFIVTTLQNCDQLRRSGIMANTYAHMKLVGDNGDVVIKIPGAYVQGFLLALKS